MSDGSIKPPSASDNSLHPAINYFDSFRIQFRFDGHSLKEEKATFAHKQVVNIYIVYVNLWQFNVGQNFTPGNCLLELLMTNAYPDKYKNSGYCIGFD